MKKIFALFLLFTAHIGFAATAEDLPIILSDEDAAIYSQIFELQAAEKIPDAQKLDDKLSDPILIGDVLYQRYMSKTYRSAGAEIAKWMEKYYDQPGSDTIYKLAQKKQAVTRSPKLPNIISGKGDSVAQSENWTAKTYSGETGKKIDQFKNALRRGNTKNARNILEDNSFKKNISDEDYGRLAGRLAFLYYADAVFDMAEMWAELSAKMESEYGLWTAGLLSYRQEKFKDATDFFDRLSKSKKVNDARKIEAAFWAGRAAEADGDSSAAKKYWTDAAKRPHTFYGALASVNLGKTPHYEFFDQGWSREDLAEIMKNRYGLSALALLQIGEKGRAEKHLRMMITAASSDRLLHAVHAIATTAELPRTAMQVAPLIRDREILEIDQDVIFSAQYPLPDWEPMGGWSIDRALLFAITRQESGFKVDAKSHAGANGLMQLMPTTARRVARQNNMNMSDLDISNPEHNMFLGQQYIVDLLSLPYVNNCIIKMLISYNSGPGTLTKWTKKFDTTDPLLFIESFPSWESRAYVKRVFSNLWMYRARLNQPLTSIQELAEGTWPKYESEDEFVRQKIFEKASI